MNTGTMTLDEAIQHCLDKEDCTVCGQEHKQLRLWLEELKDRKQNDKYPKSHGRLIDADAHIKSLKDCFCKPCQKKPDHCINCGIDMYIRIVENEPTIISAEG